MARGALIRPVSDANPRWGAPRTHGELLKLGIDLSQATVAKHMARRRRPPSQTWRMFLANHAGPIVAAEFLVVPTATGRLSFVLVMLAHEDPAVAASTTHEPRIAAGGRREIELLAGTGSSISLNAASRLFVISGELTQASRVGKTRSVFIVA